MGEAESTITPDDSSFFPLVFFCLFLVVFAGLMSGLNLGLLSLDNLNLNIIMKTGTSTEKKAAKRILPLVKQHHILLVTLLLWNSVAMEMLPLFLDKLVSPTLAIILSVTAVLLFGEIIPQAACSRYGLSIGAFFSIPVWILIILSYPISWPIAKLLDVLLGTNHNSYFKRSELKALVNFHRVQELKVERRKKKDQHKKEEAKSALAKLFKPLSDFKGKKHDYHKIDPESKDNKDVEKQAAAADNSFTALTSNGATLVDDEINLIKGALDLSTKAVGDSMIPLEDVVMLNWDEEYTSALQFKLRAAGHSRIPVYRRERENVVGIIVIKQLFFYNIHPDQGRIVGHLPMIVTIPKIHAYTSLLDSINVFQEGHCHMGIVPQLRNSEQAAGIITLEQVLESLLGEEIFDESDRLYARKAVAMKGGSLRTAHFGLALKAADNTGEFAMANEEASSEEETSAERKEDDIVGEVADTRGGAATSDAIQIEDDDLDIDAMNEEMGVQIEVVGERVSTPVAPLKGAYRLLSMMHQRMSMDTVDEVPVENKPRLRRTTSFA